MSNRPLSVSHDFEDAFGDCADVQRLSRLSRVIEGEIIPRLLICHTATNRVPGLASTNTRPTSADVIELARLMLEPDRERADAYLETIHLRGTSRGIICAELLAPTAKQLGDLWENDECNFAELTDGLRRLESVLDEFRDG